MNPAAATTLALLLSVARAAPITTRRKGFLGGRRGARIGFIVGMVILGIILASIAFWCLVGCCCASAASASSSRKRRGPGFFGRRTAATAPPMGTTTGGAAPITTTTGLHHAGPAPVHGGAVGHNGGYAAPAGAPPHVGNGPAFPQPAHQGI